MSAIPRILVIDQADTPYREWATFEDVACYYANERVVEVQGKVIATLRGGHNRNGVQSIIEVPSILRVSGFIRSYKESGAIPLTRDALFKRDRCVCGYCGRKFREKDLTMEHILPEARGGRATWTNIVAACVPCNSRKACRTPEEAGMDPVYLPYVPNRYEGLILEGRKILEDQMKFLIKGVPKNSRLLIN